jgi:hypothetical protein
VYYLEQICQLQAEDRAFDDIACQAFLHTDATAQARDGVHQSTRAVLARAQEAGALRADFTMTDLSLLVLATSRITEATRKMRPTLWRRHFELMLDALRADRAHKLAEPPLRQAELRRALESQPGSSPSATFGSASRSRSTA